MFTGFQQIRALAIQKIFLKSGAHNSPLLVLQHVQRTTRRNPPPQPRYQPVQPQSSSTVVRWSPGTSQTRDPPRLYEAGWKKPHRHMV